MQKIDSRKVLTDEQRQLALIDYKSGINSLDIAAKYGCSRNTIIRLARAAKATISHPSVKASRYFAPVIEDHAAGILLKDIALKHSIGVDTVRKIIRTAKLEKRKRVGRRTHTLEESFFEKINSEAKAYFLGFLYADGCVHDNGKVSIDLQYRDIDILEVFKQAINSSAPITEFTSKARPGFSSSHQARFSVHSAKMCSDLIRHGCTPRKSFTISLPKLPEPFMAHFLRGFIDGDGWIAGTKSGSCINVGMIGPAEFIETVSQYVKNRCSVNVTVSKERHPMLLRLSIGGGNQARTVLKYLTAGATIQLARKKALAEVVLSRSYVGKPHYVTGSRCWNSKLTEDLVLEIARDVKPGDHGGIRAAANRLQVSVDTIASVVYGQSWTSVTGLSQTTRPGKGKQ